MKRSHRPLVIGLAVAGALAAMPWRAPAAQRSTRTSGIELRPGLVITTSVRVVPRTYRLAPGASPDSGVIVVRGDDLTVDFAGATLEGAAPSSDPDRFSGVGIRVEGGRNVRLRNARIRGYKVGILVRGTHGVELANNDVSHNWKPRLLSVVEHESLADWLSFHHNEKGEWLRYGAAIYLDGVRGGDVRGNRAEQGMNGLLIVRSDSLRIRDNVFAFNSGLGIGLYRSSANTIVRNRLDYNVRGYSHGFYRRGQDSAGLLMYEQSSGNVVAFNSVTHGGDGLFLWAGQSTMDTGAGGANDNWFIGNDFSYAPANGIETTFSRNRFVGNRVVGNDYGVWGGYSYDSDIRDNCFARNRIGIAIEHGQNNHIASNLFDRDTTAISLWANAIEPSDWGYPKHRDTRSRDYRVRDNTFTGNRVGVRVANTSGVAVTDNRVEAVDSFAVLRDASGYQATGNAAAPSKPGAGTAAAPCASPPPLRGVPADVRSRALIAGRTIPATPEARFDRSAMIVDEWGPYDWRSPKLWPLDSARAVPLRLRVLGPTGSWRVATRRGVAALSRTSGRTGDTIAVTPAPGSTGDWQLRLEYAGAGTVTPRGERAGAGARQSFAFGRFEPPAEWSVRFFAWADSTDPRDRTGAFAALLSSAPLLTRSESRLDYEWYRPAIRGLPQARFALEATTTVSLAPGDYSLRALSDDGVRVWVDGALVIDRWTLHETALDTVALAGGRHALRVQYFQVEGWAELRVEIVRGAPRLP